MQAGGCTSLHYESYIYIYIYMVCIASRRVYKLARTSLYLRDGAMQAGAEDPGNLPPGPNWDGSRNLVKPM